MSVALPLRELIRHTLVTLPKKQLSVETRTLPLIQSALCIVTTYFRVLASLTMKAPSLTQVHFDCG
jgi:hypothetical protein